MSDSTIVLKPGFMVSLHTRLTGGVNYKRVDKDVKKGAKFSPEEGTEIAAAVADADKADVTRWETTRVIEDKEEYDLAVKERAKCGSLVRAVCAQTAFGLLCDKDKEADLNKAIVEARKRATEFNGGSRISKISVFVLKAVIAQSDVEAARAISSEMSDLVTRMQAAIVACDVDELRAAANKARAVAKMLDGDAAQKASAAIEAARAIAKDFSKKLVAKAESAAFVVDKISMEAILDAQCVFVDMDDAPALEGEALAPVSSRAVDLEGDDDSALELTPLRPRSMPEVGDVDASEAVDEDARAALGARGPEIEV